MIYKAISLVFQYKVFILCFSIFSTFLIILVVFVLRILSKVKNEKRKKKFSTLIGIVSSIFNESVGYYGNARRKIFFHRTNFSNFLLGLDHKVLPVTVDFWPSLACNASCEECPYKQNNARNETKDLIGRMEEVKIILNNLSRFKRKFGYPKSIILTGGGEPFMNRNIGEISKLIVKHGFKFGVFTNGTLPNISEQINEVIKCNPTFFRISVNSGSEKDHKLIYKIPSLDVEDNGFVSAYEMIKYNFKEVVNAKKKYKSNTTLGFGYVFKGNELKKTYEGIRKFGIEMFKAVKHPFYLAFRTLIHFYDSKTEKPIRKIPDDFCYSNIEKMANEIVNKDIPNEVNVQVSKFNINYLEEIKRGKFILPKKLISVGWSSAFNHRGVGFIMSELNGSPFKGSKWGDLRKHEMKDLWFGKKRLKLCKDYCTGKRLTPVCFKTANINLLLLEIRKKVGILNKMEVNKFWKVFDEKKFEKPTHCDFI